MEERKREGVKCKSGENGGQCTIEGIGAWENNFFYVFLKKKFVFCLEVEIISYLCIRKKFSKTGNFYEGENEKVFRFGKLLKREKNANQLK
jgi:hypothetical protein